MKLEPLESRGLRELVKELVFQLQQNSFVEKVDLGDFLIFQCTNRTGVLAGQREAAWFSWQSAKQVRREKKHDQRVRLLQEEHAGRRHRIRGCSWRNRCP